MKEQIIEFETARIAKKKGFDWNTSELYTFPEGKLELPKTPEECYQLKNWNKFSDTCTAPTQSLLQKWLREEHNVTILVQCTWPAKSYYSVIASSKGYKVADESRNETYEQALEAALIESLKTI